MSDAEVKTLAAQTARATEDIAAQIGAIQSATSDAAQAIEWTNLLGPEHLHISADNADKLAEKIDNAGAIWASDISANAIYRFAPTANGNVAPITTISGSSTTLNGAVDIQLH